MKRLLWKRGILRGISSKYLERKNPYPVLGVNIRTSLNSPFSCRTSKREQLIFPPPSTISCDVVYGQWLKSIQTDWGTPWGTTITLTRYSNSSLFSVISNELKSDYNQLSGRGSGRPVCLLVSSRLYFQIYAARSPPRTKPQIIIMMRHCHLSISRKVLSSSPRQYPKRQNRWNMVRITRLWAHKSEH